MTENNDFNNTENDSTNSGNKKRFTLVFDHEHDGIGRIEKDNIPIHNSEVVEMLNELSDENEQLKQDKKRLIGFLHRYTYVDVEDIDEVVLSKEYFDEWGELYYNER